MTVTCQTYLTLWIIRIRFLTLLTKLTIYNGRFNLNELEPDEKNVQPGSSLAEITSQTNVIDKSFKNTRTCISACNRPGAGGACTSC